MAYKRFFMIFTLLYLLLNSCLSMGTTMTHPFYVSVTDAHYKPDNRTIEIAQKVFWDDMEEALSKKYGSKINLAKGTPSDSLEVWLDKYALSHHFWWVNQKKVAISYVGYEVESDVIWIYLIAKNVDTPKNIKIKNSLLTDYFPEQKNITHFYINDQPKSIITDRKRQWEELEF